MKLCQSILDASGLSFFGSYHCGITITRKLCSPISLTRFTTMRSQSSALAPSLRVTFCERKWGSSSAPIARSFTPVFFPTESFCMAVVELWYLIIRLLCGLSSVSVKPLASSLPVFFIASPVSLLVSI